MISDADLLRAVKEATSEEFVVYGELGRERYTRVALLAMERKSRSLVVLIVDASVGADGGTELIVTVETELDGRVPDGGTFCAACGTRLRPWGRFCQNCGSDATGPASTGERSDDEMRAAVIQAVAGEYDLLGEMRRKEGGGCVFFAREKASGRIAALRLNRGNGAGEYELGETMILKAPQKSESGPTVSITQMLRRLEPEPEQPRPLNPSHRSAGIAPRANSSAHNMSGTVAANGPTTSQYGSSPSLDSARPSTGIADASPTGTPRPNSSAELRAFAVRHAELLVAIALGVALALLVWAALS